MKEVCDDRYAELYRSRMAVTGDISLTFGFHDNKRRLDWLRKSTVSMFRLSLHCEEGKCYDFYSVFMKEQNTIYKKKYQHTSLNFSTFTLVTEMQFPITIFGYIMKTSFLYFKFIIGVKLPVYKGSRKQAIRK